jgi:hypothetical protein
MLALHIADLTTSPPVKAPSAPVAHDTGGCETVARRVSNVQFVRRTALGVMHNLASVLGVKLSKLLQIAKI